jgi:hypothetical protein
VIDGVPQEGDLGGEVCNTPPLESIAGKRRGGGGTGEGARHLHILQVCAVHTQLVPKLVERLGPRGGFSLSCNGPLPSCPQGCGQGRRLSLQPINLWEDGGGGAGGGCNIWVQCGRGDGVKDEVSMDAVHGGRRMGWGWGWGW